jgi:hypothetical protein
LEGSEFKSSSVKKKREERRKKKKKKKKKKDPNSINKPGIVVCTCNPGYRKALVGRWRPRPAQGKKCKPLFEK